MASNPTSDLPKDDIMIEIWLDDGGFTMHKRPLWQHSGDFRKLLTRFPEGPLYLLGVSRKVFACFKNHVYNGTYFERNFAEVTDKPNARRKNRMQQIPDTSLTFQNIWECVQFGGKIRCPSMQDEGLRVWYAKFLQTGFNKSEVKFVYNSLDSISEDFLVNVYGRGISGSQLFEDGRAVYPARFLADIINLLKRPALGSLETYMKTRDQAPFTTAMKRKEANTESLEEDEIIEVKETGNRWHVWILDETE